MAQVVSNSTWGSGTYLAGVEIVDKNNTMTLHFVGQQQSVQQTSLTSTNLCAWLQ